MNLQQEINYVTEMINTSYNLAKKEGHEVLMMQLTNDNQGFSQEAIVKIRAQIQFLKFEMAVHISILPSGKQPSSIYLYDGLVEIYCNDPRLKKAWISMRQTKL